MKLGLMVTTGRFPDLVRGLAAAAIARGHGVTIFATDDGVRLLHAPAWAAWAASPELAISYCAQSMERSGGRPAGLPSAIRAGSQFDNALMLSEADRVIVL